jgi:hypothetical protein
MADAKQIPFKDVAIGTKIKFPNHTPIYTRVSDEGKSEAFLFGETEPLPRTLTFEVGGMIQDAYVEKDSETLVTVIEENNNGK